MQAGSALQHIIITWASLGVDVVTPLFGISHRHYTTTAYYNTRSKAHCYSTWPYVIECCTVTVHSCEFPLLPSYCCCDTVNTTKMCVQYCVGLLRIETLQNICLSFVHLKSVQIILSQMSTPNIPAQPLAQETGRLRPRLVENNKHYS